MALVNSAWREGEFVPPGAEPGLTNGFAWRDAIEARTARQVADQRFKYPTADAPTWKTEVNLPNRAVGVRDAAGGVVFPDIVVIDGQTTEVTLVAEIETVRSLAESADLPEKWRTFASLGPLYLFVPMSDLDKARSVLRTAKIKLAGLRTWRYMAGMDFTDISDVQP